jgi:hypothetical protein
MQEDINALQNDTFPRLQVEIAHTKTLDLEPIILSLNVKIYERRVTP